MRVRVCVFVKYEMWMCLDGWRWHIALRPLYDVRDVVRSTPLCHAVLHIKYSICIAICVYHIDGQIRPLTLLQCAIIGGRAASTKHSRKMKLS